ncbi:MAG: 3-phosphoshikimate 1-carboxyvinyltransferase, partial [Deltaproteobacteria bacterium]|nr:3-phosphoshikimate 1-carboxyvinyltransferase [Deltaproteobacteria bacterium]
VKESDRVAVMAESLTAVGVKNTEKEDGIVIEGASGEIPGGKVQSHGDHRIAMSMAIAALRSKKSIEIAGAQSVDVSFPGFFSLLESVKA